MRCRLKEANKGGTELGRTTAVVVVHQIPAVVGSSKYGPEQWPRQLGQRPRDARSKDI